jgi:NodT family efflux transporter outer membrane factor (OMF) lipoprotein
MIKNIRFLSLCPLALSLVMCTVGPDYIPPNVTPPDAFISAESEGVKVANVVDDLWWEIFGDDTLSELVHRARSQNLSLQSAGLRILESHSMLGVTRAGLYPSSQVNGRLAQLDTSPNSASGAFGDSSFADAAVSLDMSWEIDFWHRFRRDIEASEAILEREMAQFSDALLIITAETARAYITVRLIEERLRLANDNEATQLRAFEIATVRFENGATTELDVAQARTILSATRSVIPALASALVQSKNALVVLLNESYVEIDNLLSENSAIPGAPAEVVVGIPADLLRRRPDIQIAERNLAAQSALIGIAESEFYPRIGLNGSFGFQSSNASNPFTGLSPKLSDIGDTQSSAGSIGPFLSWNVLNFGRIRNNVLVQDARFQQLLTLYRDSVINAIAETDNALAAYLRSIEQTGFLASSAEASLRAVELASIQYQEGVTDFNRVVTALQAANAQQDRLAQSQGNIALNLVNLYRSLGGGWGNYEGQYVPDATRDEMRERTPYWNRVFD